MKNVAQLTIEELMSCCEVVDDEIILTGFGQLAIEGKIDTELKQLTISKVKRQLHTRSLTYWDGQVNPDRKYILETELKMLNQL